MSRSIIATLNRWEGPTTSRSPASRRSTRFAAAAGIIIGFVGGAFRWCLVRSGDWAQAVVDWSADRAGFGWVIPLVLAAVAAVIARWIVLLVPLAGGSGIQHVEAVWRGEADFAPPRVVPAKFAGGLLARRRGCCSAARDRRCRWAPSSVSRPGAASASTITTCAGAAGCGRRRRARSRVQHAVRRCHLRLRGDRPRVQARLVLGALASAPLAVVCSRLLVGNAFDLPVPQPPTPGALVIIVFAVRTAHRAPRGRLQPPHRRGYRLTQRFAVRRPLVLAGVVGAGIGVLFFVQPLLVGEGTDLTRDVLAGQVAMWPLAGYLIARGLLGPLWYAVGTPGGLFSPLLRSEPCGVRVHGIADTLLPGAGAGATAFAVVGMAAFFAGVVRAPLTGVALILEMTGATHLATVTLAASSRRPSRRPRSALRRSTTRCERGCCSASGDRSPASDNRRVGSPSGDDPSRRAG